MRARPHQRKPNQQQPKQILQEETHKLQNRLEALREQVQQQRNQKKQSKQGSAVRDTGSANTASSEKKNEVKVVESGDMERLLTKKKLEHLVSVLRGKGVRTVEQLREVKGEQVDEWKDIAVGYRIKLKQVIASIQVEQSKEEVKTQQKEEVKEHDIEDIISKRRKEQVYVPLQRQKDEPDEPEEVYEPQDQEVIIQSLSTLIHPVITSQKEQISRPPSSQTSSRVVPDRPISSYGLKQYPQHQYCWSCLKKVESTLPSTANHCFCSQSCFEKYQTTTDLTQKDEFFQQVRRTELSFHKMHQKRQGVVGEQSEEEDMEVIDLAVQ